MCAPFHKLPPVYGAFPAYFGGKSGIMMTASDPRPDVYIHQNVARNLIIVVPDYMTRKRLDELLLFVICTGIYSKNKPGI